MAVYNNVAGPDAVILNRFREPAWNNPVVRFLNDRETDLIARQDGDYSVRFVLHRMVAALEQAKRPVPKYLKVAVAEASPKKPESVVFAMYCYWEGEAKLGSLEGVIGTRIGTLVGAEVVEVAFDSSILDLSSLVKKAIEFDCTHRVFVRNDGHLADAKKLVGAKTIRTDEVVDVRTQQQYHLAHYWHYYYLPLTPLQATRCNAALAAKKSPDEFLSPKQLELKKRLEALTRDEWKPVHAIAPDRSWAGIAKYEQKLEAVLSQLK